MFCKECGTELITKYWQFMDNKEYKILICTKCNKTVNEEVNNESDLEILNEKENKENEN